MLSYVMKERSIRLNDHYDVIVVGGGPSGCTAATAAAREGAKTLLIEGTGCLGGMGTSGLVPAWCPFSDLEKIIYKGLAEKVFEETKKGIGHVSAEALDWVPIDPELLKRVYDDMVTGAGADVLFNTTISAVEMEEDKVSTIIVTNKDGLSAYKAKIFVDCTGDADLAAWAGAEVHKGDEKDGELQPVTHCFVLSNVDNYAYHTVSRTYPNELNQVAKEIAKSDKYPLIIDDHFCNNLIGPGNVGFNAGHQWKVDNTNPLGVSKALINGRKMAAQFREGLAEYYPKAFANSFLVSTGSLIGCRETRRIVGDYELSVEDYLDRRTFEDEICRNSYFIDIHHSVKERQLEEQGTFEWEKRCARYGKGESHGIPYRCLTPKGIKNVLVAGRSISCDRSVQASVRVMPVCLATGEAAGIAAVVAINCADADVHAVDVQFLRRRLREEGAYLPEAK
jgi:hypothetical protein